MGGLVVKKACILGQNNEQYQQIVKSTTAVVFLSTPHRGADSAALLNRILAVAGFNRSKQYVAEMKPNSPALQDINEQFRHIALEKRMFSFYETQQTTVGPRKMMVLEVDSSTFGYSNEVPVPLDADHHNVCKFTSQQDPNYVSVRNALRSLIPKVTYTEPGTVVGVTEESQKTKVENSRIMSNSLAVSMSPAMSNLTAVSHLRTASNLLAVSSAPEDDLEYFRSRGMRGTCEWIYTRSTFLSWFEDTSNVTRFLWVNGLPGCGKSVLSASVIRRLQDMKQDCQYFFFRFGDHLKRTVSFMLRSIAYQIALMNAQLRTQLNDLADDAVELEKADERTIWRKIYLSRVCKLELQTPMYWVIDALDECDDPQQLLSLLSSVSASQIPLRVMLVSRKTEALTTAFQRFDGSTHIESFAVDGTDKDVERYVAEEVQYIRGGSQLKARMKQVICDMANGNFLWVHLILREMIQCHTEEALNQSLRDLPTDLKSFYQRMALSLCSTSRPGDRGLSKSILTWVICSERALTLEELTEALKPDFNLLDPRLTIGQVCKDFVVIDSQGCIRMLHQTAQDYLVGNPEVEHSINPAIGHQQLFMKCISYLPCPNPGAGLDPLFALPLLHYAATSWPHHLGLIAATLDHSIILALGQFFGSTRVLAWIHLLATQNHLRSLVSTSQSLTAYLGKRSELGADDRPRSHRMQDTELLELWAVDLVKIVGKFGAQLLKHPTTIHALVPALCPVKSMLYQQFGRDTARFANLAAGFSCPGWDECLSRISFGRDCHTLKIVCMDRHFAILTIDGTLQLYDTATGQPSNRLVHGERVVIFRFSRSYEKCVTWGLYTTKVWHVESGRQILSISSLLVCRGMDIVFSNDESTIMSWSSQGGIQRCLLDSPDSVWQPVPCDITFDSVDGKQYGLPSTLAFETDGTKVTVAYLGSPLLVWDVRSANLVGRCVRTSDRSKKKEHPYTNVGQICWNPVTGHVLGFYSGGPIFKWHPLESDSQEIQTIVRSIRCSPGGASFVTSDKHTLKVWNFRQFSLIYQLSGHTYVKDLALSPDGRRVYDLRGSFCNISEPDALARFANLTSLEAGSTQLSPASQAAGEISEPMTAFAVGPRTSSYCLGDDVGKVRLKGPNDEALTQIFQGFGPINHLIWCDDETNLIIADSSGGVTIRSNDFSCALPRISFVSEAQISVPIDQILISPSSDYLLIHTRCATELWSLSDRVMITKTSDTRSGQFTNHPLDSAFFLQWHFSDLDVIRWSDLKITASYELDRIVQHSGTQGHEEAGPSRFSPRSYLHIVGTSGHNLNAVFVLNHGRHILLQTSCDSRTIRYGSDIQYLIVSAESLVIPDPTDDAVVQAEFIPSPIAAMVEKVLGLVDTSPPSSEAGEVLAFIDQDNWICSLVLAGGSSQVGKKVRRHFFLPQDWLSLDGLQLATVSRDGTFYCPRNGEVAVVKDWLENEWVE